MKKKIAWTLTLLIVLSLGCLYYFISLSFYEPSKDFFNFPVPKNAKLEKVYENAKSYNWSAASEENGIPYSYELAIKANGWKKGQREGALVIYKKGNHTIELFSFTKSISINKKK